ncbi:MAG: monovalent cation/H(+) antiporter subunit G [Phycisphaerales bacterium]
MNGLTMTAAFDFIAAGLLGIGLLFMLLGAVGVARLPDCYSKMHASSKCTTLGLTGMLLAACLHLGDTIVVSKAIVTVVFTFVAMPIGSHLLAKAAHHVGVPLWSRTVGDELAEDKLDPTKAISDAEFGCWEDSEIEAANKPGKAPEPMLGNPVRAA